MTTSLQTSERTVSSTDAEAVFRDAPEAAVVRAIDRAVSRLAALQLPDGHWAGDYGGPLFLLPGLVIAHEVLGRAFTPYQRERMTLYLGNVQNEDGGWGLHIEGSSTVLGTALNYVALRLLGSAADTPRAKRARRWLHEHGGVESIPTWGKVWLAVLGVYEWDGVPPLLPELWLLPRSLPMHPSNFWCHTRAVLLPMTYLYGRRARAAETATTRSLRDELYVRPYASIAWPACADKVHPLDAYTPHTPALRALNRLLTGYQRLHSRKLREHALAVVMDHIHHEDESTSYLDIGPVSKALHMVCVWFEDPEQPAVARHLERVADYLWDGRDGMKMQGYNGSQFWDLAFAMQAILEHAATADAPTAREVLASAFSWLDRNQVAADVPDRDRYYRNATAGSFPFSTAEQAWPVTDCTAEGIKAALAAESRVAAPLSQSRLEPAIDMLLFEQNADGGWSEYERARAPRWLERLNAAEVFGDIMIGYSAPECSSACIQGLCAFHRRYPDYRAAEVRRAIERGRAFLGSLQRPDGSWYGTWGVCFTYATWFGIDGLLAARSLGSSADEADMDRVVRAADFLVARQHAAGGWGESYLACVEKRWVAHERPQPVQTAWALLGLLSVEEHLGGRLSAERRAAYATAIRRGVELLLDTQGEDGWRYDMVYGVFNRNCMINYDNYRYYFPLWALARAERLAARSARL